MPPLSAAGDGEFGVSQVIYIDDDHDAVVLSFTRPEAAYLEFMDIPTPGESVYLLAWDTASKTVTQSKSCRIIYGAYVGTYLARLPLRKCH